MKRVLVAMMMVVAPLATAGAKPPEPFTPSGVNCADGTNMTSFAGYVACLGAFGGNINGSNTGEVGSGGFLDNAGGQWAGAWSMVGKSDASPNGHFNGGIYTSSGIDYIDFDGPLTGKFVVGVKQSNDFSFYLFNWTGQTRTALDFRGVAPNNAGYSHINLYTVTGTICERNCNQVPEPMSAALVVTGLAGLAVAVRRRRHHA